MWRGGSKALKTGGIWEYALSGTISGLKLKEERKSVEEQNGGFKGSRIIIVRKRIKNALK